MSKTPPSLFRSDGKKKKKEKKIIVSRPRSLISTSNRTDHNKSFEKGAKPLGHGYPRKRIKQ
jgi:hypothetical protein